MRQWATSFFSGWDQTLKTYFVWMKMVWLRHLEYRLNTFFNCFGSVSWVATTLVAYKVIFGKVNALAGWTWEEMLLLYGVYNFWWGIMVTFFSGGLRMSRLVRRGELDRFLIWPGKSWFYASMKFVPETLVHALSGIVIFTIAAKKMALGLSLVKGGLFLLLMTNSFILVYFVSVLFGVTAFWLIENEEITEFFWLWEDISKYPPEFFSGSKLVYLLIHSVLPVVFIAAVPTRVLLGEVNWLLIAAAPLVTIIFGFLALRFWRAGLRRYTGVSI